MKNIALFLTILLLLMVPAMTAAQGPTEGSDGIGDDYYPQAGNGGYDVQHYDIAMTVEGRDTLSAATVIIDAIATQDLSRFNLDFAALDIAQVVVNGDAATFEQADRELIITPRTALAEGEAFSVQIDYSGKPESISTPAIPIAVGWRLSSYGSFTFGEPYGASSWYPVNDHPLDKATYSFAITVPDDLNVAANGRLIEIVDNGDGTATHIWRSNDLMASYLTIVSIDRHVRVEAESGNGIPIRHYFPEDLAARAFIDFSSTADMMDYFETIFGPYPFEVYGVVVVNSDLGFAMETQTISLFGRSAISGTRSVESTAAHELAHQWYGNSISPARWQDIWLNEGFASYASVLWFEHRDGPDTVTEWETNVYEWLSRDGISIGVPLAAPPNDNLFYTPLVYVRGALTLHALRLTVGDDIFFDILRTYSERFQYQNATTEDFIGVAEDVSGQDLTDFFDAWLFSVDLPALP